MLDGVARKLIDPPLNRLGAGLARCGVGANQITLVGLSLGLLAAFSIGFGAFSIGLGLLVASRLADGLDGAVARAVGPSDFGGYLDITADFVFYGAVPLGFVIADPSRNAIGGAALLAAFYFNGASFLGYAILAEKRGLTTASRGVKSLYFTGGLLEGTETIAIFVAMTVWPVAFPVLALLFAAGCVVTGVGRMLMAAQVFSRGK